MALHPERLNLISLCTGGGGLDLGVELAMPSARSVVLVEREAFAASQLVSAISQGLMAEAAIWSDVTTFNGRPWRGIVDGVIGGIPCQPHSLAGQRKGEDDERDLWSDARRIFVQSGAWFILIENVRGMLSSGGAERVWRDLRRLGCDVEGGLFTASEVGASHERERVFILAVANRYNEHDYWPRFQRPGRWGQPSNGRGSMADAGRDGRSAWASRSEFEQESSVGEQFGCGGDPMVHAGRSERGSHIIAGSNGDRENSGGPEAASRASKSSSTMADSNVIELRREPSARKQSLIQSHNGNGETNFRTGLFPPGPSDLRSWESVLASSPELEPAFRRVADGLASRLDVARVDRLRMLGNGVVCLEGAYALRTLATRLAASGSIGANRLVRAMDLTGIAA